MPIYIPPNGLAGFAQQTPAVQSMGRTGGTRKRSKVRAVKLTGIKKRRRRAKGVKASRPNSSVYTKRRKKKGGALVKGSPEAKRRMAALRKMRK